ncbi:MAG: Apolipoprotein N-acyltransferase [Verrucomicrobiales bacterium]|nr:Apolipoprotein N-acyltransferase [Verrucomicrobiales bacterium]
MPSGVNECASERGTVPGKPRGGFSFTGRIVLTVLSAAVVALCMPGRPCPWLAWVVMVPMLFQLRHTNGLRSFLLAGIFGWLGWFTSVWWLYAPLHDMLGMSVASAELFIMAGCLLMALPYALAGVVVCRWKRNPGILGAARDAAIFTMAITWLTPVFQGSIAHTQYCYPLVLQLLELGGAPLLLFFILWVNWLLADGLVAFRNGQSARNPLVAAFVVVGAVLLYGGIRLQQFESAMKAAPSDHWFTVGAIQPNIPIHTTIARQPAPDAQTNDFYTAVQQAKELVQRNSKIDLLAFPENPATFLFNNDTARRGAVGKLISETHKPVVLNADAFDPAKAGETAPERYNVALLLDADRNLSGNYAKIERVPVVEYIPGESKFPWLRAWFPKSQRVLQGAGPVIFEVKPGIHLIPLICYEGTSSSLTRQFVGKGGNVIVNQVNDSWFLRTSASEIHLALTLFRTAEYRLPLVRVTNSGIGAHIQATGQIVPGSRTALFTKTETAFPLYVPPRRSLYAEIGNWWMLAFGFLAFSSRFRFRPAIRPSV